MRVLRLLTLVGMLLVVVQGCGTSEDRNGANSGDTKSEVAGRAACSGLLQDDCEASDECEPYLAWPKELACTTGEPAEPPSFMGCGISGGRVCSSSWTWAFRVEEPEEWSLFINSCLPPGWKSGDGADLICDAQPCVGLSLADCESTYHCFPVHGALMQDDCTEFISEYAGCWTGEKLEGGEVVAFTCATVGTWAHPADEPEQWYSFPNSCVPDGWVISELSPCEDINGGTTNCIKYAYPGDEQSPGDDCWDPPANYCADGASEAEVKACSPDFATCCKFGNYCIPCGWVKCSYCEDDTSREEKACTQDEQRLGSDEVPECADAPISVAGDPACPDIEWSEPVCVEWE
jgi:hypothetical protein